MTVKDAWPIEGSVVVNLGDVVVEAAGALTMKADVAGVTVNVVSGGNLALSDSGRMTFGPELAMDGTLGPFTALAVTATGSISQKQHHHKGASRHGQGVHQVGYSRRREVPSRWQGP